MLKKIILQFFLLLIIFLIVGWVIKAYFTNTKLKTDLGKIKINNKKDLPIKNSNLIKNMKYVATDSDGNNYTILSKFGSLSENDSNLIFMTKVSAFINMKDRSIVKISSDKAIYNGSNYNTSFQKNVFVVYEDNTIVAENLDLLFEKKKVNLYETVVYKNLNTRLEADNVEIDLATNNSKIFMDKKSEKVKIISLN
jgi:lipopolysaccharide export system protein LptA